MINRVVVFIANLCKSHGCFWKYQKSDWKREAKKGTKLEVRGPSLETRY